MSIFTFLMLLVLLTSLGVGALTVTMVFRYNKKYHLPESEFTKLFHKLTKEQIAYFYIALIAIHAIFTVWLIITT